MNALLKNLSIEDLQRRWVPG